MTDSGDRSSRVGGAELTLEPVEVVGSRLEAALADLCVTRESRPLVAFSGGPDSAALLALLAYRGGFPVTALHVDHGLRPSSADEALRAVAIARELGVACEVVRVEPTGRGGPEARARRARYRALAAYAEGRPVLTAHTADDQAETVLLRLARGAGARGLSGIRPRARIEGAEVRRPLLGVRRDELRRLLDLLGVEPVEDPSNLSHAFARNRLRADVIPAIVEAFPGAIPAMVRAAGLLAEDEAYMGRRADRALLRLTMGGDDAIDAAGLLRLAPALRGRVIRRFVERVDGPVPSRAEVDRILALAAHGGELHLRRGLRLRCRRGRLLVAMAPAGRAAKLVDRAGEEALLRPGEAVEVGRFRLEVTAGIAGEQTDPGRFELPSFVAPPFRVGTAGPGQRVSVPGAGSRKVRDLLRESRVPVEERGFATLLWAGEQPAWLVGIRALRPRPAPGAAAWVFTVTPRPDPGNEGWTPLVGADG